MRLHLATIAILAALPCLACAAENQKKQAVGIWQSPEKDSYFEINQDGTIKGYGLNMRAKGKWKEDPTNKKLLIDLNLWGGKLKENLEATIEAKDKLSLEIEGRPSTFTRRTGKTDPKKFVGTWKASQKDQIIKDLTHHWVETRTEDGRASMQTMTVSDSKKAYTLHEVSKFKWRVEADCLLDTTDHGTEDEMTTIYTVLLATPEKLSILAPPMHPSVPVKNTPVDYIRVNEFKLPKPPEGYKEVELEAFWEPFDKLYEEAYKGVPDDETTEVFHESETE